MRTTEQGFTLVEIIAAIVLLALGLTTLIGMQTNYVDNYARELNQTRAALYAQYIMTMFEANPIPLDASQPTSSLQSKLKELGYFDEPVIAEDTEDLEGWTYELEVTPVQVYEGLELLRRYDLRVRWSNSQADVFQLVYFQKIQQRQSR